MSHDSIWGEPFKIGSQLRIRMPVWTEEMSRYAFTPDQAEDEMRKAVKRGDREEGIQLLCQLARMTGHYRVAEMFEANWQDGK